MLDEDRLSRPERIGLENGDELMVLVDGRLQAVPWSAVTGVSAGRAKLNHASEQWVFVLAIEIEIAREERLFIVGEVDPAWVPLTTILPLALPGIEPYEVWGAALVHATKPIELYQRAEPAA